MSVRVPVSPHGYARRSQKMIKEKLISALVAIAVTATAAIGLAMLSIEFFDLYGAGIFLVTPFVCGAVSVLIYNRKGDKKIGESLSVALIGGCLTLLGFLALGLEGLICLAMAAPIVVPLFIAGGILGFAVSNIFRRKEISGFSSLLLIGFVPLLMGFESRQSNTSPERSVQTSVVIDGTPEAVWREVIAFSPIPEPKEWLFRIGIAYPTEARIEGDGVGAIRYCNFSTGSFVEPITHWEENKRLAFDVVEQPEPMIEISPYTGIHPPHLDWAIRSERGEFKINDLGDGRVELIGTTWYRIKMEPEPYWGWLTDKMIQMIHLRVLNHIRQTTESDANQTQHSTARG